MASVAVVPGKKKQPGSGQKKSMLGSIISGEKRKEKKKQKLALKEQADLERIINAVHRVDAPVNPDSSEWKEFQKMQEKIVTALVETQAKLTQINETTVVNEMLPQQSDAPTFTKQESLAAATDEELAAAASSDGSSAAHSEINASTATLSSANNESAIAVPDDPFDTRIALEVLQKAAEICALVEKVQVARMQEHGYDVGDYDPFDTSKARAVVESLKNSTLLANARKQGQLISTDTIEQEEVADDDDPFNTSRALGVITKAVALCDRLTGKAKTVDDLLSMETEQETESEDDVDPFDTSRATAAVNSAMNICSRVVPLSPIPAHAATTNSEDTAVAVDAQPSVSVSVESAPNGDHAEVTTEAPVLVSDVAVHEPEEEAAAEPQQQSANVSDQMSRLQPGNTGRRPPPILGNLQPADAEVAINIIGPTPVATPMDVRAPTSFDRARTSPMQQDEAAASAESDNQETAEADRQAEAGAPETSDTAQRPLPDSDSETDRVPTPQATPLEDEQTATDSVVADVVEKLEKMKEGEASAASGEYFDFTREDAANNASVGDDAFFASATQMSNAQGNAFAPEDQAAEAPALAPVEQNAFADDQFVAVAPDVTDSAKGSELHGQNESPVDTAAAAGASVASQHSGQQQHTAAPAVAPPLPSRAAPMESHPPAASAAARPQAPAASDVFSQAQPKPQAQQPQIPPREVQASPAQNPVTGSSVAEPAAPVACPRKPSLDESSDEETNPFAVNFKIRQSARTNNRFANDPIPVLLPKPTKVDKSQRVADPLGIEESKRQQQSADQDAEDEKFEKLKFEVDFDDDAKQADKNEQEKQPPAATDENQAWHVEATHVANPDEVDEFTYVPPKETFLPFHPPVLNNEWRFLMRLPEKKKLGVERVWQPVIVRLVFPEEGAAAAPSVPLGYTPTHAANAYSTPKHNAAPGYGAENAEQAAAAAAVYSTNPFATVPAPSAAPPSANPAALFALPPERPKPLLRIFFNENDPRPAREYRLESNLQLSKHVLQPYDQFGKLHVVKVQQVTYKEMVGMKAEKLMSFKTLQTLITKPKGTHALDHLPQPNELAKLGSLDLNTVRTFTWALEDAMMTIESHRDTTKAYAKEEIYVYQRDEYEAECDQNCRILTHQARARVFFLAFVTGMPFCELGVNDKWRMGREVVRRQDIIPVMHDDWIDIYEPEFHCSIDREEYEKSHVIRFQPLDGSKVELMRFRVSLRENRELPLQVKCRFGIDGQRVTIRCDLIVPGYYSRNVKLGQVPCEKIEIRVPIPEAWINLFRTEKTFKPVGSIHSVTKKAGKIKGLERISQVAQTMIKSNLLEVDCGVAKYEHLFRAIVWRIPRLPERNEGLYKTHLLTCQFQLSPQNIVPPLEQLEKRMQVEYKMPSSTVSGTTVRSIAIEHPNPPEKWVRYKASFVYTVEIDYAIGRSTPDNVASLFQESEIAAINANTNIGAPSDYDQDPQQQQQQYNYDAAAYNASAAASQYGAAAYDPANAAAYSGQY